MAGAASSRSGAGGATQAACGTPRARTDARLAVAEHPGAVRHEAVPRLSTRRPAPCHRQARPS